MAAPVSPPSVLPQLGNLLARAAAAVAAGAGTARRTRAEDLARSMFKAEELRRRDDAVVNSLYVEPPLQCTQCGLRFFDRLKMDRHMDRHFQANLRERDRARRALSRLWFLTADAWAGFEAGELEAPQAAKITPFQSSASEHDSALSPPQEPQQQLSQQPLDEPTPVDPNAAPGSGQCAVCLEKLEEVWDPKREHWMYRGALRRQVNDRTLLFHTRCWIDFQNQQQPQSQPQPQPAQPFSSMPLLSAPQQPTGSPPTTLMNIPSPPVIPPSSPPLAAVSSVGDPFEIKLDANGPPPLLPDPNAATASALSSLLNMLPTGSLLRS
jgi:hypothetical protein